MELILDALGVTLGGRAIVSDVSARLAAGQVTVVLGPNGAGKSTLVRAAAGLIACTGRAAVDGVSVATMDAHRRARLIGYLPQNPALHWNLRVAEVVALGRLPHRSPFAGPSPADRTATATAMAATDVTTLADRTTDTLSGGERARVLLARVLAGEPGWLIADEPLASLDPAHQDDLLARMRRLAAGGTGVLLVLHDLAQAARIADQVLLIDQGRLIAAGMPRDVLQPALLRAAYGIDFELVATAAGPIPVTLPRTPG